MSMVSILSFINLSCCSDEQIDIEFVVTDANVTKPTKQNSKPLNDGSGRGSFVYFNQASMFTAPETGYDTLWEAGEAGVSRRRDYGEDAAAAFTIHGTRATMPAQ